MLVLFADNQHVIQLTLLQGSIAVGIVLVGIGIAWGTLRASVGHIATGVTEVKASIEKLRDTIGTHATDIAGIKVHTKYGVNNSPTVPSEEGSRLLAESGFDEQYPKFKDKLFKLMDDKNPRTLYDYEVAAFEVLGELKDDPLIDPLKDYAVNHPGEPLELIFRIASWIVRDDYAAYKGKPTKHN